LLGVDDLYALWRRDGALEIGASHTLVKVAPLLFEAIEFARLRDDSPARNRRRQVEQHGQVRLQVGVHPFLELRELPAFKPASAALVGIGGVAEAVADDPVAPFQGGFDDACQVFAPGGEHQQRFGFEVHRFVQQQFAQRFAERGTPGFTGCQNLQTTLAKEGGRPRNMAALARTVDPFEGDELAAPPALV
jgi:hypothetical protein